MGYPAIPWAFMDAYIRAYRALLRGEVVEWEGTRMQMLHPDGHAPARPVEVPVLIAALGPKGNKVAHELGDGLFATLLMPEFMTDYSWTAYLAWGTVLDEGEPDDSEHARVAAGPGWALSLHGACEFGGPDAVRAFPRGMSGSGLSSRRPIVSATWPCTPVIASRSMPQTRPAGARRQQHAPGRHAERNP